MVSGSDNRDQLGKRALAETWDETTNLLRNLEEKQESLPVLQS